MTEKVQQPAGQAEPQVVYVPVPSMPKLPQIDLRSLAVGVVIGAAAVIVIDRVVSADDDQEE